VHASFQEELDNGTEKTQKKEKKEEDKKKLCRKWFFIDTKSKEPLMIGWIIDEQKLLVTWCKFYV
jgi:hypothetical protein